MTLAADRRGRGAGAPGGCGANCPDSRLLREALDGLGNLETPLSPLPEYLYRGYLGALVQVVLAEVGCTGVIPPTGDPAPGRVGARWTVERTHS